MNYYYFIIFIIKSILLFFIFIIIIFENAYNINIEEQLYDFIKKNKKSIISKFYKGIYLPNPVINFEFIDIGLFLKGIMKINLL